MKFPNGFHLKLYITHQSTKDQENTIKKMEKKRKPSKEIDIPMKKKGEEVKTQILKKWFFGFFIILDDIEE